jgi:peptide/nickel transport system substrate-binding protein
MKSKHTLLTLLALLAIFSMLVSCSAPAAPAPAPVEAKPAAEQPTAAPQAEEPTAAPKAEEPTAAPEAEAAAPAGELQDAIPYPDPPDLGLGQLEVKRQPISEIVTYKALDSYKEPTWVTDLVKAGKLPPVEERLPKEPRVILSSGMADGVGVYGDVGRFFSACPTAGWNIMAGTTAGWFGIEHYSFHYSALVDTGPLWRADQDVDPFPLVAKSWEWSDDGKQLTMHLIEGAKWSDGEPFSADDVIFTWEDFISDPNVNSGRKADSFAFGGTPATLEKLDDNTIKWTFGVSKPPQALYYMGMGNFDVMPAHVFKPLHPKYNPNTDYKTFANQPAPQDLPMVTLGPWVPVEYKTDQLLVMRRNPYFYAVDETGQQLPYIDEIQYQKGPSGTGRTLCVLAGGCDQDNLENPSVFVEALKAAGEADAPNQITWGPETLGYALLVNQSADLGVQNDRDTAVRELFRDVKFRRALSQAMDRDGIAQAIMRGPFLRPWAGGLYPGSPVFDQKQVVYYPFSVDTAKALLAELGLKDTDNNGILNWTTGSQSGQDVILSMSANQDQLESNSIAEALVNQFAAVGLKINFRPLTSDARTDQVQSGQWDLHVDRMGQVFALPHISCADLAPITKNAPSWHREGDKPRQLQPFEEELIKLVTPFCESSDPAERQQLMSQYNKIFTENLYDIGVFVGRYGENLTKRFKNVNPGLPAFLYDWTEGNIMLEQVWSPVDQHKPEVRPNTVPEYEGSALFKLIGK